MPVEPEPIVSVIIPVYNGADSLERCLKALIASDAPSYECIVVNDGSTDGSQTTAEQFTKPVQVVNLAEGPRGPAYARNRGAEAAHGSLLFFVDADIVLAAGALQRVVNIFRERPDVAAVFGSYDARPAAAGLISRYRNLLHHYVHQNGKSEASTFWAGCGAIRRSVFQEVGGFDEKRFPRTSIEDIELGYRLRQSGYRILLDKELQGKHLKHWNLRSIIRTDITCRAVPWSRLILETGESPDDLNLKRTQRLGGALAMLCFLLLLGGFFRVELVGFAVVALLGVLIINRDLYIFFFRQQGSLFAVTCVLLHLLYYLYSGLSYLYVWAAFQFRTVIRWTQTRSG